jgi:hypothetical protein
VRSKTRPGVASSSGGRPRGRGGAADPVRDASRPPQADGPLVDVESRRELASERLPGFGPTPALCYTGDGRALVIASRRGPAAELRDATTGGLLRALNLGADGTGDLATRPADGRLPTLGAANRASGDRDLREWDLPASQPTSLDDGRVLDRVGVLTLISGGRQLVALSDAPRGSAGPDEVQVHDVTTGQVVRRFPWAADPDPAAERCWSIRSLQPSPDGTKLAVVEFVARSLGRSGQILDARLHVWDLAGGRPILRLDHDALGGLPWTLGPQPSNAEGTRLAVPMQPAGSRPDGTAVLSGEWALAVVAVPSGRILRTLESARPFHLPWIRSFSARMDEDAGEARSLAASDALPDLAMVEARLGHVLGFNSANPSFQRFIVGNQFTGPSVEAANNGRPVAVTAGRDHWAQGTLSDGLEVGMEPNLPKGIRRLFGTVDFAALRDMGWDTSGPDDTIHGARQTLALSPAQTRLHGFAAAGGLGRIAGSTDVNIYRVYVAAGDTLSASIGPRLGGTNLDTYVRLFDGAGVQLAAGNQGGVGVTDSLRVPVTRTDYYYVAVSSFANRTYNPLVPNSGPGGPVGDYA